MRIFLRLIACAGIALTAAGCDPTRDKTYLDQGVGVDLYTSEGLSTLAVRDAYFSRLCTEAGLSCTADAGPPTWSALVRAGMNDIDERCDGYLTWLDDVRRSKGPLAKQITDTGTAANLIMQASGASSGSLAIVAAAFGLASQSFDNLSTRLLLEVPQSTVQAVVLSRQKAYREDLFGSDTTRPVVIPNLPAAVYAMRSYLRLCMPITIEMEINNTVAAFERGGAQALVGSKTRFISAKSVGRIANVNDQLRPFNPPPPPPSDTRIGPFEKRMSQKDMKRALDIVGCSGTDFGLAGSPSRKALAKFLTDNHQPSSDRITNDAFFNLRDLKADGKQGTCSG